MDWEHVYQLLEVVELSRGHPNLKAIHDKAMAELDDVVKELEPKPAPVKPTFKPAETSHASR